MASVPNDCFLFKTCFPAYPSLEYPVAEEEDNLLLKFRFKRLAESWNKVQDFELQTDEPNVAKLQKELQNIIITGIMGHETGEDFAIEHY